MTAPITAKRSDVWKTVRQLNNSRAVWTFFSPILRALRTLGVPFPRADAVVNAATELGASARVIAAQPPATTGGAKRRCGSSAPPGQILLVSHDLSASGAPILLKSMAGLLIERGWGVTVLSPSDGPLADDFAALGAAVLIAPHSRFRSTQYQAIMAEFYRSHDAAIGNTVMTAEFVHQIATVIPCIWYFHEVDLLAEKLASGEIDAPLALADTVLAGSELSAGKLRALRPDVKILPYGFEPIARRKATGVARDAGLTLGVFGSFEPRKGQDLLLQAVADLAHSDDRECLSGVTIALYGRVLDEGYFSRLQDLASTLPCVRIGGELGFADYQATLRECDAVLVPSRSDTLPLVSVDAMGSGIVLLCTATTGTAAYLATGVNGYVAPATVDGIRRILAEALRDRQRWPEIGTQAFRTFEAVFSRTKFAESIESEIEHVLVERSYRMAPGR